MTKIAIISQAEQGVLIDISGCNTLAEAKQYLTSTLQVSSQFWDGLTVDLNLGPLALTADEVSEILAIVSEVGVKPKQIFSADQKTRASLIANCANMGQPQAMTGNEDVEPKESITAEPDLPTMVVDNINVVEVAEAKEIKKEESLEELLSKVSEKQPKKAAAAEGKNPAKAPVKNAAPSKAPERSPAVLYLKQTLRSGQAISHKGHLVIVGDVNPGAEIMAEGDITVWGALRGMAHAGVGGNIQAEIRALKFEPIQLRIAHAIARSPDKLKNAALNSSGPETARIIDGKIRISAIDPE